jgi:hypothetical protein
MTISTGTKLGPYEIIDAIGAMGEVPFLERASQNSFYEIESLIVPKLRSKRAS